MRLAGHSRETPRRWWFSVGVAEVRFYRFGVELYLGPPSHFIALGAGTLGFEAAWVSI